MAIYRVGYIPAPPMAATPAHDQTESHKYIVHYPEHLPREEDPNYKAFNAYHRATGPTARCFVGAKVGFDSCSMASPLELHHAHVEFSLQNAIYLPAIQIDYPEITDVEALQKWVESEPNFRWLCVFHHRGHAGTHTASHSDWEAGQYVKGLLSVRSSGQ